MTSHSRLLLFSALLASLVLPLAARAMERETLFSTSAVHKIEIELSYADWFAVLEENRETETYVAGTITIDGEAIDSVGVRFKGNSTWGHPGRKKPLRLKFSEYREDLRFAGAPSIVLNNGFKDPSLLRDTIGNELIRKLGYGSLTGFANVTFNGEFVGFYASFKLSKNGEFVGLYAPTGAVALDTLSFGPQQTDLSAIRSLDGLGPWMSAAAPTPDEHNGTGGLMAVVVSHDETVKLPLSGGSFSFQATVFNRSSVARSADA
ncbi:MAG: hypothetical protein CME06_12155 [Gemmatimonadetes bacterium]|nr:hypothetical protein [Gemmatimonadota bacterium]